jgi:hypothetical protein
MTMSRWMIRPRGFQWELRREMSAMPYAVYDHLEDAVFAGRMEALAVRGELFVTDADGNVRLDWSGGREYAATLTQTS